MIWSIYLEKQLVSTLFLELDTPLRLMNILGHDISHLFQDELLSKKKKEKKKKQSSKMTEELKSTAQEKNERCHACMN